MMVNLDKKNDFGEDRYIGIGFLRTKAVVLVFTEPRPEVIRLISIRKAARHEEERFREALLD
jgi:uncharacterized protein